MSIQQYMAHQENIAAKADHIKEVLLYPQLDENTGLPISDESVRAERLMDTLTRGSSVYEALGKAGPMVAADHANCLREYAAIHGVPDDNFLAAGCTAIENAVRMYNGDGTLPGGVFEGIYEDMSKSDGILKLERQIALIFPVMLRQITSSMINYIPGAHDEQVIFLIDRVAASTFGDFTKGDIFSPQTYRGQYTEMDMLYSVATADGTETGAAPTAEYFGFSSNDAWFAGSAVNTDVYPFKPKTVKIFYQGRLVATDVNGDGALHGSFTNDAGGATTVTGTVDYAAGIIDPVFSVAPEDGKIISVMFDIDLEKDPAHIIPLVTHQMQKKTVYPHESGIGYDLSLQAFWAAKREFSLDSRNMLMNQMVNILAKSEDDAILSKLRWMASFNPEETWVYNPPASSNYMPSIPAEYYRSVKQKLLEIDTWMANSTPDGTGLSGVVAPTLAVNIFRTMDSPGFTAAPGYRYINQPHYVGKLFDWDLFADPQASVSDTCLCYGKGTSPGMCAFVGGIAVAPITFRHPMTRELTYNATMWGMKYRDICPFDHANYYVKNLKLSAA